MTEKSLHILDGLGEVLTDAERAPVVLVNRGQPRLVLLSAAEFRRLKAAAGESVPDEAMPRVSAVVHFGDGELPDGIA